jgi:hypothetical protein
MKPALFALLAVTVLVGLTGCAHDRMACGPSEPWSVGCMHGSCAKAPEACASCGPGRGAGGGLGGMGCMGTGGVDPSTLVPQQFTPGPPVGQVTYPYYTLRGPRDFLARNPRSIGP